MKNLSSILITLLPLLVSNVSASPIHEPRQLAKRGVAPLWNESGPSVRDVRQVKALNCWWAASSLAVLMSSQRWIENMVRYANGSEMVGQSWPTDSHVQVTVWNPNNFRQETFTADHDLISQTEDNPNGNWWHDALSQGARAMAKTDSFAGVLSGPNPTWDPKSGSAITGLAILTGYVAWPAYTEHLTHTEFFELCQRAVEGTPIIFNTVDKSDMGITTPQLGHAHDYAVFNGTINEDGQRMIWARNSWGSTDAFKLEEVYKNTWQIIHLRDFNVLGGGRYDTNHIATPLPLADNNTISDNSTNTSNSTGTGNGTETSAPINPKPTSAPTANPVDSNSTVPGNSSAPDAGQSGISQAPSASASGAGGQQPSQPPAAGQTASGAPAELGSEGGGNNANTSPFQWTSAAVPWSTTYPFVPFGRATKRAPAEEEVSIDEN